jgi:DNA-binding transcriptional LysR family regulator
VNINLKLLHTFLLVAEHNSFAKAAEHAHRSAPAVSMQIKQLESQLGLTLFRRTTRRVELTNEGSQLLSSARKALQEIDNGLLQLRDAVEFHNARLAISCIPTLASARLPRILAEFSKEHPRVTVFVRELGVSELQESVRKAEVDFGLGPKSPRMPGLDFRSVLDDEYYALVAPDYRSSRKRGITLKELAALPVLGLGASSSLQQDVNAAATGHGVNLKTHYEFAQVHTIIAMAEAGLGVAVLPHISLPDKTRLKALRIIEPVLRRELGIISLRGQPLTPVAQRFAELAEELLVPGARG